jgi:hypothetical protein
VAKEPPIGMRPDFRMQKVLVSLQGLKGFRRIISLEAESTRASSFFLPAVPVPGSDAFLTLNGAVYRPVAISIRKPVIKLSKSAHREWCGDGAK